MNPKRICLFLLAMCVLIAPLPAASVGAEDILLIQIQDGVISYSADGGQSWSDGVPDGAQISITMPQPTPSAPIPTQSPDPAAQSAAPQTYFIQAPVASVQNPYPMMVMQSGCCCCQQGALNASQLIANSVSAIPETDADAQSEAAPEQTAPAQPEEAQPEAVQPEEAQADVQPRQAPEADDAPASDQPVDPVADQPAMTQSEEEQPAPDPAADETQSFIVPALDLPDQSALADATEAPSFSIQIDIPEDYEPTQSAQAPSAQQSQQYVTVEPSQAVQLQPAASDPDPAQAPQAVATQSPAERQAMIANQTEVLLGTAANGETVWVWHDVSGNPIFSTDNGLSWSNNEPEGLVIAP